MAKEFTPCSVEGCNRRFAAKSLCLMHYKRWKRHGSPTAGRATPCKPGEPLTFYLNIALQCLSKECLEWPFGINSNGYGILHIDGRQKIVSRIACHDTHGPPPTNKHEAAHRCGNSKCVNPNHLYWATSKQNNLDRKKHGTMPIGEKCTHAKLSNSQVRYIKSRRRKQSQRSLAEKFGVSASTISHIQNGRNWKWMN